MSDPAPLPTRPRLVLRAGFTGRRELIAEERNRLASSLGEVLDTLGHRLAALAPGVPVDAGQKPRVSAFYAPGCPLLRLVTGLCEGADAVAAEVLETVSIPPDKTADCAPDTRCLETELAAVLPFDVESYRSSRPADFRAEFDRLLVRCAWVLALDGIYAKPDPDTALAARRRAHAYRSQSAFLIRHSDVLIAAANPDEPGRAGGALETVRDALAFELPVVFIHTGTGHVYCIRPEDNLHSVLADPPPSPAEWRKTLHQWINQITADPDSGLNPTGHDQGSFRENGEALLTEFFDRADSPSSQASKWTVRFRKWAWASLEKHFRSGPDFEAGKPLEPFGAYRQRTTDLDYHYGGLYRGAFLLNYALAIVAVILAAASLTLLGTAGHTSVGKQIAGPLQAAGYIPDETVVSSTPPGWLLPVLLVLALGKLSILIIISRNTRRANSGKWNDRAVDYRYLAERLRAMVYLPLAGSHQPPAAAPPQFASRVVRQSAVDWLFDAIVRAIPPSELPHAKSLELPAHDGSSTVTVKKLLTVQPLQVAETVRDAWVGGQAKYHERNSATMHALHHATEKAAVCLGITVICVVALDLVLIGGKVLHWLPEPWVPFAHAATPWLIFVSAVLPAVVAALGGIRFQSECQRLAERSAVIRVVLSGRINAEPGEPRGRFDLADHLSRRIAVAQAAPESDPGSWAHDTLRLTERIATDFVQEAAEWSVLYAKEVSDPG
jgi:hypothetical protein